MRARKTIRVAQLGGLLYTGTPPLTRFFGPAKNRVIGEYFNTKTQKRGILKLKVHVFVNFSSIFSIVLQYIYKKFI